MASGTLHLKPRATGPEDEVYGLSIVNDVELMIAVGDAVEIGIDTASTSVAAANIAAIRRPGKLMDCAD